jgi:ABC-type spermidine/putrescine transport system permease subunit II
MTPGRWIVLALGWLALLGLLAPLLFAAWVSFSADSFLTPPTGVWSLKWYVAFAADQRWTAAMARSAIIGAGAAVVALVTGVPLAYAITRHRFHGRGLLAGLVLLPACAPPVVLGMGLLPFLYAACLWGNPGGLILAHGLVGLPFVFLIVRTHLAQTGVDLEAAARGLGASPWQTAVRVTLPLLSPALLAGAAAAFALSLNEALLTVFLTTPSSETLPAVIWPQLRFAASPLVAVASCLSVGLGLVGVVAVGLVWRGVTRRPVSTDLAPRYRGRADEPQS